MTERLYSAFYNTLSALGWTFPPLAEAAAPSASFEAEMQVDSLSQLEAGCNIWQAAITFTVWEPLGLEAFQQSLLLALAWLTPPEHREAGDTLPVYNEDICVVSYADFTAETFEVNESTAEPFSTITLTITFYKP